MDLKTFKICLFQELPNILERDRDYIYLTYDKLLLFFGQNQYYDPYVICEAIPEEPIAGYLYILFNGQVKTFNGDEIVDIAEIEDESQAESLRKLGTTYFIKADRRYLDLQRRTLQLPYHNGTYSMTMDMARDLQINDNTVVRYDQSSESFYIDGDFLSPPRFKGYEGKESKTVSVEVNDRCIHAEVRVSKASDNLIQKLNGGLYANVNGKVSLDQFEALRDTFKIYQAQSDETLAQMRDLVSREHTDVVSESSILAMVVKAVSEYNEDITRMVEYYDTVYTRLKEIETESKEYTDKVFKEKSDDIDALIGDSVTRQNVWGKF